MKIRISPSLPHFFSLPSLPRRSEKRRRRKTKRKTRRRNERRTETRRKRESVIKRRREGERRRRRSTSINTTGRTRSTANTRDLDRNPYAVSTLAPRRRRVEKAPSRLCVAWTQANADPLTHVRSLSSAGVLRL